MSSSKSSQFVEVQLEIGHRATVKTKQTTVGHTHDWTVFVRGPENSNIQHFVEKVVFYLHESFPKPKRVIKDPPYEVSESGYASFELPIEVYFKNKDEPKKINFEYDLYLRTDGAVANTRREKLTFKNPSNDFKKKLLRAGGVTNESSGTATKAPCDERLPSNNAPKNTKTNHNTTSNENKKLKSSGVIPSKDKSLNLSSNSSSSNSNNNNVQEKPIPPSQSQFTDLFGPPIQARTSDTIIKKQENPSKGKTAICTKELSSEKSKYSHKNSSNTVHSNDNDKKSNKNLIDKKASKVSSNSKTIKESSIKSKTKYDKNESSAKKKKTNPISSSPLLGNDINEKKKCDTRESSTKKRRRSTSSTSSSVTCNSYAGSESTLHLQHSPKSSSSKEHDTKKESKKQKISKDVLNSGSSVKKESSTSTKISFSDNNSSTTIEIKSVKKEKLYDSELKKSKSKEFKSSEIKSTRESIPNNCSTIYTSNSGKSKVKDEPISQKSPKLYGDKHLKVPKEKYPSNTRDASSSPSSFSGSLTPGGIINNSTSMHPPLSAMMAEMGQESLSPLSSSPASLLFEPHNNPKNSNLNLSDSDSLLSPKQNYQYTKDKICSNDSYKAHHALKRKRASPKTDSSDVKSISAKDISPESSSKSKLFRDHYNYHDLIEVQERINESTDSDLLQKIVDIIEESGNYQITNTTFDFDLMKLDATTVKKLKTCFT